MCSGQGKWAQGKLGLHTWPEPFIGSLGAVPSFSPGLREEGCPGLMLQQQGSSPKVLAQSRAVHGQPSAGCTQLCSLLQYTVSLDVLASAAAGSGMCLCQFLCLLTVRIACPHKQSPGCGLQEAFLGLFQGSVCLPLWPQHIAIGQLVPPACGCTPQTHTQLHTQQSCPQESDGLQGQGHLPCTHLLPTAPGAAGEQSATTWPASACGSSPARHCRPRRR